MEEIKIMDYYLIVQLKFICISQTSKTLYLIKAEACSIAIILNCPSRFIISCQQQMNKNPKVIMLGDTNVGKTSILQVLLHETFQEKMSNTLGACFHRYQSEDSRGDQIIMDIWDTAGQERFRSLLTLYYKNSDAVVIVFDVCDQTTFSTVDYWARQIQANCQSSPCVVLVGNKVDLKGTTKGVSKEQVSKYLSKRKRWEYIECSAKENLNIKQIFKIVAALLKQKGKQKQKLQQISKTRINPEKLRKQNQSTCC